ncbi:hypothetical protein FRC08_013061 [Ceratobasidium sp. 394]|nr:hypothetical protein FRC08_013061 [Ceratobasidium sp. 394]
MGKIKFSMLFQHLTDSEKSYLLDSHGCLYGIHVDAHSGSRMSSNPIARCKAERLRHLPNWFREVEDTITEIIQTQTDRDSNYVHHGWSTATTTTLVPWIASRIARGQVPTLPGAWTTIHITVKRLAIQITLEDITPVPEFEAEMQAALGESTDFHRFEKVNEAFNRW